MPDRSVAPTLYNRALLPEGARTVNIVVLEELKAFIEPLTPDERDAL